MSISCSRIFAAELTLGHAGSIPELSEDDKVYNSSPIFSPDGKLVAVHRKVHLFDIDVPGGITFKESDSLTGGDWQTIVETGSFSSCGPGTETDSRSSRLWQGRCRHLLRRALPRAHRYRRTKRCAHCAIVPLRHADAFTDTQAASP